MLDNIVNLSYISLIQINANMSCSPQFLPKTHLMLKEVFEKCKKKNNNNFILKRYILNIMYFLVNRYPKAHKYLIISDNSKNSSLHLSINEINVRSLRWK